VTPSFEHGDIAAVSVDVQMLGIQMSDRELHRLTG
jgi:hypothetical protein